MPEHMIDGTMLACMFLASVLSVPLTMVLSKVYRHVEVACDTLSQAQAIPETAEEAWLGEQRDDRQPVGTHLTNRLAHGALAGAAYLPLALEMPVLLVLGGVASGIFLWAGSRLVQFVVSEPEVVQQPGQSEIVIAAHCAHALGRAVAALVAVGF